MRLDHAKYISEYTEAGIKCYTGQETIETSGLKHHNLIALKEKENVNIGSFHIMPFDLQHNVHNFGFLINHSESGMILFITDTNYCKYTFPKINHFLIEANFDQRIMEENILSGRMPALILKTTGENHMSIETCIKILKANDLSDTKSISLLHLSNGNSNEIDFIKQVESATGIKTIVACAGTEIELNKNAFYWITIKRKMLRKNEKSR